MITVKVAGGGFAGVGMEMLDELAPRAEAALRDGSQILLEEMRRTLSRHGPPLPGEPPAQVTGELKNSLETRPPRRSGRLISQETGSPLAQAGRLEYGGSDRLKRYIPPHPWGRVAEAKAESAIERRLEEL